jgi:LysM repeat protein
MLVDSSGPIAAPTQRRSSGLSFICLTLALLGGVLMTTVGVPRLPDGQLRLPSGMELELLARSPSAEQLASIVVMASWAAWLAWTWLVATVILRVIVVLVERITSGGVWTSALRAASDRLTLPAIRTAVDASLAGLLVVRAVTAIPQPALAQALTAQTEVFDTASAANQPPHGPALGDLLYTVQPGDSLGTIAERYYGDWSAYEQIYDANRERPQQDGRILEDARAIYPGWTLVLPRPSQGVTLDADRHLWYVVQPGDTLSEIAARLLGDRARWTEIDVLNRGVAQTQDGRTFTSPGLIWPGLQLRLPASEQLSEADSTQSVDAPDAVRTVMSYYELIDEGDAAGAAELMRDGPRAAPALPEFGSFRLAVQHAEVLVVDPDERHATVAVELEATDEARAPAHRYVVHWQLARGPDGWRLAAAEVRQP